MFKPMFAQFSLFYLSTLTFIRVLKFIKTSMCQLVRAADAFTSEKAEDTGRTEVNSFGVLLSCCGAKRSTAGKASRRYDNIWLKYAGLQYDQWENTSLTQLGSRSQPLDPVHYLRGSAQQERFAFQTVTGTQNANMLRDVLRWSRREAKPLPEV